MVPTAYSSVIPMPPKLDRAEHHVACVAGDGDFARRSGALSSALASSSATAAAMAMLRAIGLTSISGRAMAQRLVLADQAAELAFACAQVVHREIEGGLGGAARIGAHGGDASGHGALDGEDACESNLQGWPTGCAAACVSTNQLACLL